MVSGRRRGGYTLLELVIAMSILGIFLGILLTLTLEMWDWEKKLPVSFQKHPEIIAVIARMRRDVLDGLGPHPYLSKHDGYEDSDKTLIVQSVSADGGTQIIVWDFSIPEVAVRRVYNVGNVTEWAARGVPVDFTKELEPYPGRTTLGIRLRATDKEGRLAIDQVFFPRATE